MDCYFRTQIDGATLKCTERIEARASVFRPFNGDPTGMEIYTYWCKVHAPEGAVFGGLAREDGKAGAFYPLVSDSRRISTATERASMPDGPPASPTTVGEAPQHG